MSSPQNFLRELDKKLWSAADRRKYIVGIFWSICGLGLLALVVGIATGLTVDKEDEV